MYFLSKNSMDQYTKLVRESQSFQIATEEDIWQNNEYEKLSQLYEKYGNKVQIISAHLKKDFQYVNSNKYAEAKVEQKLVSLISAGLDVLKFQVEVREEDFHSTARELCFTQSETVAPYIYHSSDEYLQEKVKLIKLDYDDRLTRNEIFNLLKVASNSIKDGRQIIQKHKQILKKDIKTVQKIYYNKKNNDKKRNKQYGENSKKANLIDLIQKHGNDFDTFRNVIGVATLGYVRALYRKVYKKSLRKMVSYIIHYFNAKFSRLNARDCNQAVSSLISNDIKQDPNRIELRQYMLILLKAMNQNVSVSRNFIYGMYCSFAWVTEQLRLKQKKKVITFTKEEWQPQQLAYMLQNYRQNVSFRQIGNRLMGKFGDMTNKFKNRRVQQTLKRLIFTGILEMQTIMGQRYHQFSEFYNESPMQNVCYRFMRSPDVPLQLKHQLMFFNFQRDASTEIIKKIVQALNKTTAEIIEKLNMQATIKQKVKGISQSKKYKKLNGISDQVQICENNTALNFRQYHRWTQQQQRQLFEIYRDLHSDPSKVGNRFAEVSKKIKQKFKREKPQKYSVSKVESKLSSIIRSGMQFLRKAANRWYNKDLPEQFCMGRNYEKSAKILRSTDKNVRKLKIQLMFIHFQKNLQQNIQLRNQLVSNMLDFQLKWNKLVQQNSIKIQIQDSNLKTQNIYQKAEKIFDEANCHQVKHQDYEFVSNIIQTRQIKYQL